MRHHRRSSARRALTGALAALAALVSPVAGAPVALAQPGAVQTMDPNTAIDADLAPLPADPSAPPLDGPPPSTPSEPAGPAPSSPPPAYDSATAAVRADAAVASQNSTTYQRDDLIAAGEGVFGKGAEGLASMIEKILQDQGEPTAYIAGREAAGAIGIGLRYGSGELFHKVEGRRDVYWTGPSIGFDLGANAAKSFVLVYNLYDTQDIYKRFPAAEGALYVVGGLTASYMRRGDIVLIPIRLGVGWRAGINAGYMKITEKSRILPF